MYYIIVGINKKSDNHHIFLRSVKNGATYRIMNLIFTVTSDVLNVLYYSRGIPVSQLYMYVSYI